MFAAMAASARGERGPSKGAAAGAMEIGMAAAMLRGAVTAPLSLDGARARGMSHFLRVCEQQAEDAGLDREVMLRTYPYELMALGVGKMIKVDEGLEDDFNVPMDTIVIVLGAHGAGKSRVLRSTRRRLAGILVDKDYQIDLAEGAASAPRAPVGLIKTTSAALFPADVREGPVVIVADESATLLQEAKNLQFVANLCAAADGDAVGKRNTKGEVCAPNARLMLFLAAAPYALVNAPAEALKALYATGMIARAALVRRSVPPFSAARVETRTPRVGLLPARQQGAPADAQGRGGGARGRAGPAALRGGDRGAGGGDRRGGGGDRDAVQRRRRRGRGRRGRRRRRRRRRGDANRRRGGGRRRRGCGHRAGRGGQGRA